MPETKAPHPEAGQPFFHPELPPELLTGFVVGECGHRVAGSEFRAGMRNCERCPRTASRDDAEL